MGLLSRIGARTPGSSTQINAIIDELNARYGSAQYAQPTAQAMTNGSYVTLDGWAADFTDTIGGTLSSGVYTFPSAMTVEITAAVCFVNGAGRYVVQTYINGTQYRGAQQSMGTASSFQSVTIPSFEHAFAANDTLDFRALVNAVSITTSPGANSDTWFRLKRIA